MTCTNVGCTDPATAAVLVGADWLPKCFTHEREYADRYGHADIRPMTRPTVPGAGPQPVEGSRPELWADDFARKIAAVMRDHWNHTGYGDPQCFEDEGQIIDWYDRASLFELECPACEALYALRSALLGYRSEKAAQ